MAVMSMDGRYATKSQGWRLCPWKDGMPQRARDGGYVHGRTVFHKEPGMAVMSMEGRYATKSQGWRCGVLWRIFTN